MTLTEREFWTVIHGMVLGATFLLAFSGGLAGLWSLRSEWVTGSGVPERLHRLIAGTWIMAVLAWLTVISFPDLTYWLILIWLNGTSSAWSGKNTSLGYRPFSQPQ